MQIEYRIRIMHVDGELPAIHFVSYDGAWHAAISVNRSLDVHKVVIERSEPINANEVRWVEHYVVESTNPY